jgi:hypothetical protein
VPRKRNKCIGHMVDNGEDRLSTHDRRERLALDDME